jgi:CBS domain-containing protein
MKVRDAMNINAVRVLVTASLKDAADVLAMSQASDLAVVDDSGAFVGVLSEGDILRAVLPGLSDILEQGENLRDSYDLFEDASKSLRDKDVRAFLIDKPITVTPEERLQRVAGLMAAKNIRRLPVVEDGRLIGTISRADVCRAVLG